MNEVSLPKAVTSRATSRARGPILTCKREGPIEYGVPKAPAPWMRQIYAAQKTLAWPFIYKQYLFIAGFKNKVFVW